MNKSIIKTEYIPTYTITEQSSILFPEFWDCIFFNLKNEHYIYQDQYNNRFCLQITKTILQTICTIGSTCKALYNHSLPLQISINKYIKDRTISHQNESVNDFAFRNSDYIVRLC